MDAIVRLTEQNSTSCRFQDVSYKHRVDDPESYDWCIVPDSGYDGVLFAGVALIAASCLQGKFSALWILLAGALCQAVAFPINTGRWGNALALWLGITPADLFLYVFLPPMLLDAAVRISYFHFRKMLTHVISFAFLMVLASTFIMVPVQLYLFGLHKQGWYWQHAALFAAMSASTDAVAVGAILKSGGSAPEHLILILEGESLFNDATSITLFEIMLDLIKDLGQQPATGHESLSQVFNIATSIVWLGVGGMLFGLLFGFVTRQILKYIKRSGHKAPEQLTLSLAMAYLVFYSSQVAGVSGVIAVVVFGLYGSATAKWGMSSAVTETPVFNSFWDTLGFIINGIVFFYAGASSVNFFWRSSEELHRSEGGSWHALLVTFWRLPLLYLAMLIIRAVCICLLNPIFRLAGSGMSAGEIVFSTFGGLRGAVSLILAQMLVTQASPNSGDKDQQRVIAQIALWTAGVVLLSLLINAPLLPVLIRWTGLAEVPRVKARSRAKSARAVIRYTKAAIHDLQHDEDEMLRGVDWNTVRKEVDMSTKLAHILKGAEQPQQPQKGVPRRGVWRLLHWLCCCMGVDDQEEARLLQPLLPQDAPTNSSAERGSLATQEEGEEEEGDEALREDERAQAEAIWESTEEGEIQGGLLRTADAEPAPRVRPPVQRTATPGKIIGKVKNPQSTALLDRSSFVADLPFTRQMSGGPEADASQAVDIESGGSHLGLNGSREGQPLSATPGSACSSASAAPRLPTSGDQEQLSPEVLAAHNQGVSPPLEAASSGPYLDPSQALATPPLSSGTSTAYSDAGERQPWEPDVLSIDGAGEGPISGSPPRFRGVTRRDSKGNHYTILPQPVLRPKMIKPDEENGGAEQPVMRWMTVDLSELRRQHRRESSEAAGQNRPPGPSRLLSRPSMHSQTTSSDSKMLKRAMSGPIGPVARHLQDQGGDLPAVDSSEVVVEARVRLVTGLKRYFHGKRAEGLLSANAVQLLDYACDLQMDFAEKPLFMWGLIEGEVCGHLRVRFLSRALFTTRKLGVSLRSWRPRCLIEALLQPPNRKISKLLATSLSGVMLLALEVAVEFWLALSWSPQAQWLAESDVSSALQKEVKTQSQQVWKFIINREIEAPARFQAIQTYRAAMAILRQQQHFVQQLYTSGMVDESEKELILGPIQRQERRLQRRGPHWRAPSISEVLRSLPFLAELPPRFFDLIVAKGLLLKYDQGDVIWAPPERHDPEDEQEGGGAPCERSGIFIVIAGLISRSFQNADGKTEELLMGSGGVFGLTSALFGESLPGSGPAVAIGNALSQGPVVFHWPQHVINELEGQPGHAAQEWVQLRVDLYRMAALFVVERLKSEVVAAAVTHFQSLAIHKTRRRALRRLAKKFDSKCPKERRGHLWLRLKSTEGAQKVIEEELGHALEAPAANTEEYGEDSDAEEGEKGTGAALEAGIGTKSRHASSSHLMTDQDIMKSMNAEKMWRKVRSRASQALGTLKEAIRDADVLVLEPHELFEHHSSLVLLKGTLHTAGRASYIPPAATTGAPESESNGQPQEGGASGTFGLVEQSPQGASPPGEWEGRPDGVSPQAGRGRWEVAVAYRGPCVLPWLWLDVVAEGEVLLKPQPIPFRAGPEGAVIVECPPEGSRDASDDSSSSQPENVPDVLSSLSRPSMGLSGHHAMQGIADSQCQSRRRRLAESNQTEALESANEDPGGLEQSRGKQLRVLSIKRM